MIIARQTHKQFYLWRLLPTLALLWGLILAGVLVQPALAALVWQLQTVDSAGDVGQYTSVALDSSGHPVISYFDFTNRDLKLVHCGDAACTSGNTIQTLDNAGIVGLDTSVALDSSGNPVISYYDFSNGNLKLVHCGNAACTSGNTIQTVDSAGDVGQYTSLALDSSGNPVISYYDFTNFDLKLVHCGDAACTSGNTIQIVDSAGAVGRFTALALDSSGHPVISYHASTNSDLKLVHCGDAACTSGNTIQIVDSAGVAGQNTSLALDSSGNPVISYYDLTNRDLKLVHCGNADCSSGNTIQTVDSAGDVGQYTALALDSSGNPVISYYDVTNQDLKLVQCGDAACASGNTIQTVENAGDVGQYTALALDSSSNLVISYLDFTNFDLKLARLVSDSTPPSVTLNQAVGQADPTTSNPLLFNARFSEPVTDFTPADVTLSGTADLTGASVTVSGGPSEYTLSVANVVGNGTVVVTLAANIATDAAGNGNTASTSSDNSVTFSSDRTPPVITPALTPATPNGQNGWYVSAVTVSFTCADEAGGSGLATNTVAGATLSSDGAGQSVTNTGQCSDSAGNVATPVTARDINIDQTAPAVAVTCVSNGASYTVGSVPTAACSTTDALSGVGTQATLSVTGGNPDGTGSFTATCSGATDLAGNSGSASASYSVSAAPPPPLRQQLQQVRSSLAALLPGSDSKTAKSLQKVLGKLDLALAANLWQPDGNHLTLIGDDLFNRLQDAVKELANLKNPPAAVTAARSTLVTISRSLAQLAVNEAIADHGNASKLAKAQSKLAKGDSEAAKAKWDKAIAQYEDAWEYAQQALGLPVASSLLAEEQPATTDEPDEADETLDDGEAAPFVNQLFLPLVTR